MIPRKKYKDPSLSHLKWIHMSQKGLNKDQAEKRRQMLKEILKKDLDFNNHLKEEKDGKRKTDRSE